jgi:hypothetical protein
MTPQYKSAMTPQLLNDEQYNIYVGDDAAVQVGDDAATAQL